MNPLELVRLTPLMSLTRGNPDVVIGLIDGPVATTQAALSGARIRQIPGSLEGTCARAGSSACQHGTFVAGILAARRGSFAPAICPGCTLVLRPIFTETESGNGDMPTTTPEELARAIVDCLDAGARVLNLSVALAQPSSSGRRQLEGALDRAVQRGAIVVAAAGNQGIVGSSAITGHPWVIPVAACDPLGRPVVSSNLGRSIGRYGLSAPGEGITSLGSEGNPLTLGGTSAAAPFVTGTIALLWSKSPHASALSVKTAIRSSPARRTSVVPPVLDAAAAYRALASASP